jgi:hypothetical protein
MEAPLVCPHCCDRIIKAIPDAQLYAENLPQQKTPIAGSIFRCSQWHIFAVFPLELRFGRDSLTR